MVRCRPPLLSLSALLGLSLLSPAARAAKPPEVRELRVQKVGDTVYFHVRFETPRGMLTVKKSEHWNPLGWAAAEEVLEPRLVPQDATARAVYRRPETQSPGPRTAEGLPGLGSQEFRGAAPPGKKEDAPDDKKKEEPPPAPRQPVPAEGLEFVGKASKLGAVKLLLLYPRESTLSSRLGRLQPGQRSLRRHVSWTEVPVTLELGKAKAVAVPAEAKARKAGPGPKRITQPSVRDDLEGLWAEAQVAALSLLGSGFSDVGFFNFASAATARKYNVPSPNLGLGQAPFAERIPPEKGDGRPLSSTMELYETTTGAAAIAETLALRRMNSTGRMDDGKRTIDIAKVEGINIAEHPWDKLMEGKKPASEPFARLIPHDNYYITFKSIRKFIEFGDLLDQWGTTITRAYEVTSRDYRLKQRYEQQLCLKSTALGRTLGPFAINDIAITGSDLYLREGSDIAVIFEVKNRPLFLTGVGRFLDEAREKFGDQLKEGKSTHQGIGIESYTTPLREVSLHRALFDNYVVYANSLAGLHRILDTAKSKSKPLADLPDFRYLRTIFRADDKDEDGFAYLSDAFVRQLVGPVSKIKEKRRLEALTTLYMLTNGALFTAYETGKLPAAPRGAMDGANLRPEELPVPEGKPAAWEPGRQVALSEAYGTIHFATPLIELPLDKISEVERDEYARFRAEYLGLWRQYFDPIGMRFSLGDDHVKVDTYLLPLVANSQYNELRRVSGGGTVRLDVNGFSATTLFQFLMHLSPGVQNRQELLGLGGRGELDLGTLLGWGLDPVGKWAMVRVDDSPVYAQLVALLEKDERGEDIDGVEVARLAFQMPIVLGVDIKNPLTFGGTLAALRLSVLKALPSGLTWEPLEKPYKAVQIVRVQATAAGLREIMGGRQGKAPFQPAIYYALIDGGFYLTPSEKMLHDLIDQSEARRKGKPETVAVNSSLYLAPRAAEHAGKLLRRYLEAQTQQRALANAPLWAALHRAGVLAPDAEASKAEAAAYRYLGFVPVSPDGSPYQYDPKTDEIRNERHGSQRRPKLHGDLAEGAPLARVLEQLQALRADLRFRADGIHTVLTIQRQKK
jgi:hypothetical protein